MTFELIVEYAQTQQWRLPASLCKSVTQHAERMWLPGKLAFWIDWRNRKLLRACQELGLENDDAEG